ncbi:MAG: Gx transporter family protein [Culicoidibacterales bacterium]
MILTQSSDKQYATLQKLSEFSLLLAMACVIQFFETILPLPIPIPGVKLGLANCMTLLVLYRYGGKRAWQFSIARVVIVSFITGTFLSVPFWLSSGGAVVSLLCMTSLYRWRYFSIIGVSIMGALGHSIGQVLSVRLLLQIRQVIIYLPILLAVSLVTGSLIGWISGQLLPLIERRK